MLLCRSHLPRGPLHSVTPHGTSNISKSELDDLKDAGKDTYAPKGSVSDSRPPRASSLMVVCSEAISRNVAIWIWLTRIFAAAIPSLTTRSVGPLSSLNDPEKGVTPQESTACIVNHHASIKEDLGILIKLMHIARNLLVNAEPEVPQDICAAVHFDQMVYQTIILCVNVTSKGYDGEIIDENQRLKLTDVTELCEFDL